ncbi:MAG TPA: PEP-CTERM sorting domain-containing protein [Pirellulales bacterium]|nr:PEP-CTERM sorting domain-containing protein [Pirellulales bacterium]
MKTLLSQSSLSVVVLFSVICGRVFADPLQGEVLKFEQLPLNNGLARKRIRQILARVWGIVGIMVVFASCFAVGRAQAETLYATANGGYSEIDQVDTVTNSVTTYLNTPAPPDSVMFDSSGDVIYSTVTVGNGQVVKYDPITMASTTLASGLTNAADMVLEPGGNSMLISDYGSGTIERINNLTFPVVTPLASGLGNPEGLAYVGNKLFANIGYRYGGATGKEVAQIDPVTGAILATSPGLNSLDGLTYDSYSGLLYASSLFGNLVYSIDPNNLNNVQIATGTGIVPGPDGITSDGLGNIFIASSDSVGDSHIYQLDLINNTLTQDTLVNGLDDLAPASGGGSVPEPSGFVLLGLGVFAFRVRLRKFLKGCFKTEVSTRQEPRRPRI